ncbi:hypothetical protein Barb4_04671 [Bacteroidales bacterium Barb4]|nr:hypothetical protein Barb4_04671 [Bacteroidales bacterium Barb4]
MIEPLIHRGESLPLYPGDDVPCQVSPPQEGIEPRSLRVLRWNCNARWGTFVYTRNG